MPKLILRTKFIEHYFDAQTRLYRYNYLPSTKGMTENDFKDFVLQLIKLTEQYQALYLLDDRRSCLFTMSLEIQEWTAFTAGLVWARIGVKKYAQVLAKDFYAQISGEQVLDDAVEKAKVPFEIRTFDNEDLAFNWLLEGTTRI